MQQQSTEKVVVNLNAYRERQARRPDPTQQEAPPDAQAAAIEKLAYHLLMAVRAAKEIS